MFILMSIWIAGKDLTNYHYYLKAFYSKLNLEDITDKDYNHAQKVWEVFWINNIGDCHDLHVQCNTLLLADILEKFRDTCIEIYGLDPSYFLSAPGLAYQPCLKNVNLELLTDIDMLLMIETEIRGRMCQSIHRYAKANNKYMNSYDKNIESSYLVYLDVNNLYGWAMSQIYL